MPPRSRTGPTRATCPAATLAALAALAPLLAATPAGAQVRLGHRDDFEDGTTAGWRVGGGPVGGTHPAPPRVVADGRRGADDDFLLLTAIGGGIGDVPVPGSRLSAFNTGSAWTGDYRAAGVGAVSMWVNNLGTTELFLRLAIVDFPDVPGPPVGAALSFAPVALPGSSGWTRVTFSLHPRALVGAFGTGLGTLRSVDELRLYHRTDVGFPPESVVAQLGVDDVTAVPEPSTVALLGGGLLALGAAARRRRR